MSNSKVKLEVAANAVEYLPDAMEIEQARLNWFNRIGILWIGLIVAAVLVWACLGEVDVIVRAPGHIVSSEGDIVMKPQDSAVIKAIHVKKGDIVKKDQVLITFDPTISQAEIDRLHREIAVLTAELERYQAEFNNEEYVPNHGTNTDWQQSIYKQRMQYYTEKLKYYKSTHDRIVAAKESTRESHQTYVQILDSTRKIEDMYSSLRETNVVSYKEMLEVSMTRMQNEAEVDRLRNQLVEYDHQLLSQDAERDAFIEEWRNNISEKMVSLGREIDGDMKQLDKAVSYLSYVDIKAPCDAIVHELASFPVGSAVGEAEAIITLVPIPNPEDLEVEAEIRPQDISRVHKGSDAHIKLSAFPFQKHGTLDGKVRMISSNTFNRQGMNPTERTEMMTSTYYRAALVMSGSLRNTGDNFRLLPGMETEVEIKSGRRRIITYLIYPLIKGLQESFREP